MALTLNGSANTIGGVAVGGLPDGIVDTDMLAANAVVTGKITDGTIATDDLANAAVTAAKASGLGISEVDHWRVNADWTGDANPITSNWERCDTTPGIGKIGTGLTESSGVFSFPSTGIWQLIVGFAYYATDSNTYCQIMINTTVDNWSSNSDRFAVMGSSSQASNQYGFAFQSGIMDVTDISNIKFRIMASAHDGVETTWRGDSSRSKNYVFAIKLAET